MAQPTHFYIRFGREGDEVLTFIEAIARQEGVNVPGSIPNRDDNPGDIVYGRWAQAHGGLAAGRFARWTTMQAGYEAERELLTDDYLGLTVRQALMKWAPASDGNNVSAYEANVCTWTGMTPETVLTVANIG